MGYRSTVYSLIIGTNDQINTFLTMHSLILNSEALSVDFLPHIKRYDIVEQVYDFENKVTRDESLHVLELFGDSWKWYDSYPDVQAWTRFLQEAEEFGLDTEHLRIGEDQGDIDHRYSRDDPLLSVVTSVTENMEKLDERPLSF